MKAIPDGRAEIFGFQYPVYLKAINDHIPFDEAVAMAKRIPWPEGVTRTTLHDMRFYACLPEDKEGERKKREDERKKKLPTLQTATYRFDSNGSLVKTETVKVTHYDHTGRQINYQRLDMSDEVKQAIKLPLHQRKLFGAAKDRGMSDADALAAAKAPARDAYQDRLTNAWKTPLTAFEFNHERT